MNKIYGYKQNDVIALAEFIKKWDERPLSVMFREFGALYKKAQGTVRNLYYALAKLSREDQDFCDRYLDGKPLLVYKPEWFTDEEEKELIKRVLLGKREGRSARSVILQLSSGDARLALRLQNKFRNAIKQKPRLVAQVVSQLKEQGQEIKENLFREQTELISQKQLERLKSEINGLVYRISEKVKRENSKLKERIGYLERENLRLSTMLYEHGKAARASRFFKMKGEENVIN